MNSLSPPPCFLPVPAASPAIPWTQWFPLFENFILASGASNYNADRRKAILLHCLGAEGQRTFNSMTEDFIAVEDGDSVYVKAVKMLKEHFSPIMNVVVERYNFRKRCQLPNEPVDQYITALRELVVTCAYDGLTNDMIRDQLVEKTNSHRIRDRLLMAKQLTLNKAIEIARHTEQAIKEAKSLTEGEATTQASVQFVKRHQKPAASNKKQQNTPTSRDKCYRCGSKAHKANAANCPAKTAKCHSCGKMGHYSSVCRSSASGKVHQVREQVAESEYSEYSDEYVLSINSPAEDAIYATVILGSSLQPTRMLVDTGSHNTLIPDNVFKSLYTGSDIELSPPDINLYGYGDTRIDLLGYFDTSVTYEGRIGSGKIYVSKRGTPILGRNFFKALRMTVQSTPTSAYVMNTVEHQPEFEEVFSDKLGNAKHFTHRIKLKADAKPVQHAVRNVPLAIRQSLSDEIKRLCDADVIEKIESSEWVSPIVVARKSNNRIRVCVDLRDLNKNIVVDVHPMPNINTLLSTLGDAQIFSKIDLSSAYHQVRLTPDCRDYTSFITPDGLYRHKRMPFGLASASAVFQRMMDAILKDVPGVRCFQDDILVYGADKTAHDTALRVVLQRLTEHGLSIQREKCEFSTDSVTYLGHQISAEGIRPNPPLIEAILHASEPTDASMIRSFLGICGYYSKFIANYSSRVEPLRALQRDNVPFVWSKQCAYCFESIKRDIAHCKALASYDPQYPTIVTTDASQYGIGSVLTQTKDGRERVIGYASRTLTTAERNYSVIEKEALACVWAVEYWRTYLWGRHFTLRTDHMPLTRLFSTQGTGRASARIARWAARLLEYNFTTEYVQGNKNVTADFLSRLPLKVPEEEILNSDVSDELIAHVTTVLSTSTVNSEELLNASNSDEVFDQVRHYLCTSWPDRKSLSPVLQGFYDVQHELSDQNGILLREERVVVPAILQRQIMNIAHEGHLGITLTKRRIRQDYWWPSMDSHIESIVRECISCATSDKSQKTYNAPLTPVPLPDGAWEKLAFDIMGPYEHRPQHQRFVLVLVDYYSKWPEVKFVSSITTDVVIRFLTEVFVREGYPRELVTDNGTQLRSDQMNKFLSENGIKHYTSSLYYARANGLVERMNRMVKEGLQAASLENTPWQIAIETRLFAYRTTPHSTTGITPFELLRGHKPRTRLNAPIKPQKQPATALRSRVESKQRKMKVYTDARRSAKEHKFQVGDVVRVRLPFHVSKEKSKFSEPFEVISVQENCVTLSDQRKWNVSKLVKCAVREDLDLDMNEDVPLNVPRSAPQTRSTPTKQSVRDRRPPVWMKDYVKAIT